MTLWKVECSFDQPAEKILPKVRKLSVQVPQKKKDFFDSFFNQFDPLETANAVLISILILFGSKSQKISLDVQLFSQFPVFSNFFPTKVPLDTFWRALLKKFHSKSEIFHSEKETFFELIEYFRETVSYRNVQICLLS